ncbi:MAG: hypothetical protein N2595_00620 [bacterium]|nr:hypothetical protein [bacterium]
MKIDLERELGLTSRPSARKAGFPWIAWVAGLCIVNLVIGVVALLRGWTSSVPLETPHSNWSSIAGIVESQLTARTELRFAALEATLRELEAEVVQARKAVVALETERKRVERRERIRRERPPGRAREATVQAITSPLMTAAPIGTIMLSAAELEAFDRLIDRDEAGEEVRAFLRSLTNAAQANAYLAQLQDKGDRWLNAALTLVDQNDPVFAQYCTNALYFYDIVRDVASDRAMLAYVETKRSQVQLAMQRRELRRMTVESAERTQEDLQNVEERLRRVDADVRRVKRWLELE